MCRRSRSGQAGLPGSPVRGHLLQVVVWAARGPVRPVRLVRDGRTVRLQRSLFIIAKEGLHDNRLLTERDCVSPNPDHWPAELPAL